MLSLVNFVLRPPSSVLCFVVPLVAHSTCPVCLFCVFSFAVGFGVGMQQETVPKTVFPRATTSRVKLEVSLSTNPPQLFARGKQRRSRRTVGGIMRHEDQLRIGVTTTLDEPVSETIVRAFPRQKTIRIRRLTELVWLERRCGTCATWEAS